MIRSPKPTPPAPLSGLQDYAHLRQTGTPPARAVRLLGLAAQDAARLEARFRAQAGRGDGAAQRPKFARHDRHVAAVLREGGFWALSERRVGRSGLAVCLPLIPPEGGRP